ncbi:accessory Sec system protein Asp3 [Lacticaseibacillus brantae]|uniref:Accessory Sec system protein Asp3 n=1 Tax=Lacticaseibacillus brantae DSM 23927 TaxID=1423727 RepID=A0A0R2AXS8_9LACO|nr:accessory Sec system protein Asp3 [Lacticaseibacillus brantae]KRM71831.1 hypothetical protein FC34_GL001492 [Lacticaseibacillus brantae DSM 23927]
MLNLIFWPRTTADTYNYGTTMSFAADKSVQYSNQLMPPGEPMHTWKSLTGNENGQGYIGLPLLQHGVEYYWESTISDLKGKIQTQVLFYDEDDAEVDRVILEDGKGTFVYPEGAQSYTIVLVNIHHQQFTFHYGVLTEAETAIHHNWEIDIPTQQIFVYPDTANQRQQAPMLQLSARNAGSFSFSIPDEGPFVGVFGSTQEYHNSDWQHQQQAIIQTKYPTVAKIQASSAATTELRALLETLSQNEE